MPRLKLFAPERFKETGAENRYPAMRQKGKEMEAVIRLNRELAYTVRFSKSIRIP